MLAISFGRPRNIVKSGGGGHSMPGRNMARLNRYQMCDIGKVPP